MTIFDESVPDSELPRLAIRPYPTQYIFNSQLKDGTAVTLRPIRPEDEPQMVAFHKTLSEQSVYNRYFHLIKLSQRTAHERLTRICFIDFDREMALVAESGRTSILGVGRLTRVHGTRDAEFAILVSDDHQGQGLGTELLKRLIQIGELEGVGRIVGLILPENRHMQQVCRRLGFQVGYAVKEQAVRAELKLH